MLAYLKAENQHTADVLEPGAALRRTLRDEMVGRLRRDDRSTPLRHGRYEFFSQVAGDDEHASYWRRLVASGTGNAEVAQAEQFFDANERAAPHPYYQLGALAVSDCDRYLAYSEDTVGRRIYTLRVRDLSTGQDLETQLEGTSGSAVWSADSRYLFYVRQDPETLLPFQVWRHRLGTDPAEDVLCREEEDARYYTSIERSHSRNFIYIHHGATLSDEVWWLPAAEPEGQFQCFLPRSERHEYSVDDLGGTFYVHSNRQREDFELFAVAGDETTAPDQWRLLVSGADGELLEDVELFADHLVVALRRGGLPALRVCRREDGAALYELEPPGQDPTACLYLDENSLDHPHLRYGVTSLTRPYAEYELDLATRASTLLKVHDPQGGHDAQAYLSERLKVTARDGTQVPVSLVYAREGRPLAERPLLIYGYGAYGHCIDPEFSQTRLSLLDRGWIFAIAHVRGGEDLGRAWYHAGRKYDKPNTFNDFIDVTRELTATGRGQADRVYAMGGSAGGLLMAAVLNDAPELYRGVVAQVPFVDVLTTMADEDIPLTSGEFDEWGNPAVAREYESIARWSPYERVQEQAYPHLLVTSGLHDSQVQYWEPAKWVARLRHRKTDHHHLLLYTDMDAGHSGASGRYKRFDDVVRDYGFLLLMDGPEGASTPD